MPSRRFILSRTSRNLERAQTVADAFSPDLLHKRLTYYANWLCPVAEVFGQTDWHWNLRQVEYSTDLMFKSREILVPLYDTLSRQAVLAADAPRVAGFLGKKVTPALAQEIGSRLTTRIEGRCIRLQMGVAGVKIYDKFSRVLRVETTVNDVTFFKHYRKVEHKHGETTREAAPLKKTIYSLPDLREVLLGRNLRYLLSLSSLDDPSSGQRDLQRLSQPRVGRAPSIKRLNFFEATDHALLPALQHGDFNIHGCRRSDLLKLVPLSPARMSRQLHRYRLLGLIKRVTHTYRHHLTPRPCRRCCRRLPACFIGGPPGSRSGRGSRPRPGAGR